MASIDVSPTVDGSVCRLCNSKKLTKDDFLIPSRKTDYLVNLVQGPHRWSLKALKVQDKNISRLVLARSAGSRQADIRYLKSKTGNGVVYVYLRDDIDATKCSFCDYIKTTTQCATERPDVEGYPSISLVSETSWKPTGAEKRRKPTSPYALNKRCHLRVMNREQDSGFRLLLCAQDTVSSWALGRPLTMDDVVLDFAKIRYWINNCEKWHENTCEDLMPSSQEEIKFRLIDVIDRCLVKTLSGGRRYIALSYVWGRSTNLQTLFQNLPSHVEKGGLSEDTVGMPQTIKDAILLTRMLGERYLWIDALCIVQDDHENKAEALAVMDHIYNRAILTIVAGGGIDSNAGLPGVRPKTRSPRPNLVEVHPDVHLIAVGHGPILLEKAMYSSRAWTYQEALLSRRKLIFIEGYIYFQCRQTTWFEEVERHDPEDPLRSPPDFGFYRPSTWRDESAMLLQSHPGSISSKLMSTNSASAILFADTAERLMIRQLTVESDILNAFTGLSNVIMQDMNSTLFWGIPTLHFDLFLLWDPVKPLRRRNGFPSWSWAGWCGEIAWGSGLRDGLAFLLERLHTKIGRDERWIQWCKVSGNSVQPVYRNEERPRPEDRVESISHDTTQGRLVDKYLSKCIHQDTLGDRLSTEPSSQVLERIGEISACYILHFWTFAASFGLRRSSYYRPSQADETNTEENEENEESFEYTSSLDILDKHGQRCGSLLLTSASDWPIERLSGQGTPRASHEFIFLSGNDFNMDPYDTSFYGPVVETTGIKGFLQGQAQNFKNQALYRVMLIEWKGRIAYRAGLGMVHKTAVENAVVQQEWREILLG